MFDRERVYLTATEPGRLLTIALDARPGRELRKRSAISCCGGN